MQAQSHEVLQKKNHNTTRVHENEKLDSKQTKSISTEQFYPHILPKQTLKQTKKSSVLSIMHTFS